MASDTPPIPALNEVARRRGPSERRIRRQFAIFAGAGFVLYLVATFPLFPSAARVSADWWTVPAIVAIFGSGAALAVAGVSGSQTWITITARSSLSCFFVATALWPLAWNGRLIDDVHGLYFVQFNGLPGLMAPLALRARWSIPYLFVVVVITAFDNFLVRTPGSTSPLPTEIAFASGFNIVPVAAATAAVAAARILDQSRQRALAVARADAAAVAVELERTRVAALTHDGVMSTLLAAARQDNSTAISAQARATLHSLEPSADSESVPAAFAVGRLRAAISEVDGFIDPVIDLHAAGPDTSYPHEVVRTITAAAAEAVRNMVKHTAEGTRRAVVATFGDDEVTVVLSDDGPGFITDDIPDHRMGVQISILGRMRTLPGGTARVHSSPGSGTEVEVSWSAP